MAENIYFPEDLLTLILKRLPPKSLIKFLTVSKSWYSLITNPNFISSHLHHYHLVSLRHPNHHLLLLESNFRHSLWRYGHPFLRRTLLPGLPSEFGSIAGSYHGLVCLLNSKLRTVALWNPGIRKYLAVQPAPKLHRIDDPDGFAVGFGYDSLTNNYKVVAITYAWMFAIAYAQVYSINGGNQGWKMVPLPGSFPLHDVSHISEACFVCDVIHWITLRGDFDPDNDDGPGIMEFGASLLIFDPRNDGFDSIKLPGLLSEAVDPDLCLAVIDNSLALLHLDGGGEGSEYSAVVWRMMEYGVEDSWAVLYRIKLPNLCRVSPNLWDVEEGKVFITTSSGMLIVYNAKNRSSVYQGEVAIFGGQAFGYTESLVLLDKFSDASWLQREQLQG